VRSCPKVIDTTYALTIPAADFARQAEREYRARDAALPKVTQALRDARDLLLVANCDNPKALGDFGYTVDDSPQAKAKTRTTP
jgi:hypothetical protein